MPSAWARNLPRATPATAAEPKRVTLVLPYYENPEFLRAQARVWDAYPEGLRPHLEVVVVDDGSPVPAVLPEDLQVKARLFRIGVDVPWNWIAARNIGAHEAPDGWMLLTDMDHVVPASTLAALVWGVHDPRVVYALSRREYTGEAIEPHSASFLLTRRLFWSIGGYDETLSGHYGTDGDFRRRVAARAPIHVLPDVLVRHERVGDSSTVRYQRKLPFDAAAVSAMVKARGAGWKPKTLSFPYEEVRC